MSKKKDAALSGLSKKDRAKLEARAAELAAELKAREKAAKKKAAKKGKKSKPAPEPKVSKKIDRSKVKKAKAVDVGPIGVDPSMVITAEAEGAIVTGDPTPEELEAAAREIATADAKERGKPKKGAELKAALDADTSPTRGEETDAQIKARVQAKRAMRLGLPDPDSVDRDDAEAVAAYNVEAVKVGAILLTSNDERAKISKRGMIDDANAIAFPREDAVSATEIVETESGREFVAGESVATASDEITFAKPSEAPKSDFESNGLGQYLVMRPSDEKLVGYTRVTSYIRGIEDDSGIEKWKMRLLLEGVAATEETGDAATARVRELAHVRDVAIAKARRADRRGKLESGQLANEVEHAWRVFKKAIDALADELFELGGGREKATKGTDLHALFELHDREGMQAVADLATLGQITPADLADVEAYAELIASWGIRFVDIERVVVDDDVPAPTAAAPGRVIGVAGRLDRTGYVKLPGETRARKRVLDVKTGSLEYSKGEIARQLAQYAKSKGYDLDTHEREDLKLDQKTAVVIHLPAGSATATLHAVDLAKGRKGLKIIGEMRAFRNEGKTSFSLVEHERSVDE